MGAPVADALASAETLATYDKAAEFDFGEIYGSIGFAGFSVAVNILANTETEEGIGQDFGFGSTYYVSGDYASYIDYNVSLSRGGFGFMITGTDAEGDFATSDRLANDELKFVVSYSVDFDLLSD